MRGRVRDALDRHASEAAHRRDRRCAPERHSPSASPAPCCAAGDRWDSGKTAYAVYDRLDFDIPWVAATATIVICPHRGDRQSTTPHQAMRRVAAQNPGPVIVSDHSWAAAARVRRPTWRPSSTTSSSSPRVTACPRGGLCRGRAPKASSGSSGLRRGNTLSAPRSGPPVSRTSRDERAGAGTCSRTWWRHRHHGHRFGEIDR